MFKEEENYYKKHCNNLTREQKSQTEMIFKSSYLDR